MLCLIVMTSNMAFAGGYYYPHHGWHGHGGEDAGWFAGGLILGGMLGTIFSPYYWRPAPVYVYPGPSYVYTPPPVVIDPPNRAYAYPDPSYTRGTGQSSGEWVVVPGQWVSGKWVSEHKAWAPNR
jgi:hypothetical protein